MDPSQAITYLRTAGLSEVVIAAALGTTQSTVNRIGRGVTKPAYELGKSIVDMAVAHQQANARPKAAA